MSKQAQLADGTILEFPDETPDDIMNAAVKHHIASANLDAVRAAQKAKFPTAAEQGGKPGTPVEAKPLSNTIVDSAQAIGKGMEDLGKGVMKEAVAGIPLTVAKALGTVPKSTTAEDIWMNPVNAAEKAGGIIERGVEFMAPGGAVTKIAKAGKVGLLGRAGLEAVSAYGVSGAHGDTNEEAARNALASGGLTAAGAVALKGLGRLGQRMELAAVKPLKSVIEDVKGAPPGQEAEKLVSDIYKYNLGGPLDQSLTKTETALDRLEAKLQSVLKSHPNASAIDLNQAVADAAADLQQPATAAKNASKNAAIGRAIQKQLDDIDLLNKFGATTSGKADLVIGNQFKRGLPGSWLHGFADPDNEANQIVATAVYKKVREQIENASTQAGPLIKDINRQMSDILPIRDALIQRIPVSRRRELISLKEAMGLASGHGVGFSLSVLDRMLRSPTAANLFVKGAQQAPAIAPRLGQAGAGAISSVPGEQE